MTKKLKMGSKILFVASEANPFIKVGGLGEVMHSLPKALRKLGYDARVMIPKYASIDTEKFRLLPELEAIRPQSDDEDPNGLLISNVLKYEEDGRTVAYFLENMEYYEKRANVYGYSDDTLRWILLSFGVLEFIKRSSWKPDIIVSADWQAGFIPNLLKTVYSEDHILSKIPSVFSIHNLRFQGMFDPQFVSEMNYDAGRQVITNLFDPNIPNLNGMRRGIMFADAINTVSPTYSREILTPDFGEKLDELLKERQTRLFGILNGIDYESFNPANDQAISANFSQSNLNNRIKNKLDLQKRFNLPENEKAFLIGIVSRMDEQKGFDLITQIINPLFESIDFQLIVLGDGDNLYKSFFKDLEKRFPDRVGTHLVFDGALPRMIFAGADAMLVPSKFEPCGLVQLEAMRYGAVPIVRKVGGLADSVVDFNPEDGKGTGFVFEKYDPYSFLISIIRAREAFRDKRLWDKIVKNAMRQDFSWEKSAEEYLKIFSTAHDLHDQKD